VTVESFIAWKAAFDEEIRLKQLLNSTNSSSVVKTDADEQLRPSGKQLFLMNRAGQDNDAEALIVAGEMEEVEEDEEDEDYEDEDEGDIENNDEDDEIEEDDH